MDLIFYTFSHTVEEHIPLLPGHWQRMDVVVGENEEVPRGLWKMQRLLASETGEAEGEITDFGFAMLGDPQCR